jgi:hypothetical protein
MHPPIEARQRPAGTNRQQGTHNVFTAIPREVVRLANIKQHEGQSAYLSFQRNRELTMVLQTGQIGGV